MHGFKPAWVLLLLLAGCGSQQVQIPIACQERILAIRADSLLGPDGSADVAQSFAKLAQGYAGMASDDCSEQQKRRIGQLGEKANQLSKLAADAVRADRTAAARKARLPASEAHIEFMTALQDYENRLVQVRRELREMRADTPNP